MKAMLWFRISAVVLVLFAAGHTVGFLTFRPPTAEGLAVWNAMNNVRFTVNGSTFTYGHFYKAFGLSITASDLLGAWLAWVLGSMAQRGAAGVRIIAWAMVVWQAVGIVLAATLIAAKPAMTSAVALLCLATAASLTRSEQVAVRV
ncbi:MAG TPA: hypothetical protein VHZ09_00895 [Acidobacteriaceae bacterium]|jgi:hypothetical protein|nr:hypothetical protein [Acidobacteriaceae bacterium]